MQVNKPFINPMGTDILFEIFIVCAQSIAQASKNPTGPLKSLVANGDPKESDGKNKVKAFFFGGSNDS